MRGNTFLVYTTKQRQPTRIHLVSLTSVPLQATGGLVSDWLSKVLRCNDSKPILSYREQFKEGDEEADRGNDGKTTSRSGLALNGTLYYGNPRTARSGGSWL